VPEKKELIYWFPHIDKDKGRKYVDEPGQAPKSTLSLKATIERFG